MFSNNILYPIYCIFKYNFINVIRDSFAIEYASFAIFYCIFLKKKEILFGKN